MSQNTVKNCFCQNFVKCLPTWIIVGISGKNNFAQFFETQSEVETFHIGRVYSEVDVCIHFLPLVDDTLWTPVTKQPSLYNIEL